MSIKEDICPVSALKNRAAELLAQIAETRRPVVITHKGEPKGVLQDIESYEQTREAIGLLKLLAQGEEDVRAGRTVHHGKVFGNLRRQLKARGRKDA